MTDELTHVLTLARRGAHPGASGGESRLYRIVDALRRDVYGLDSDTLRGVAELIALLRDKPFATRETIAEFIGEEGELIDGDG